MPNTRRSPSVTSGNRIYYGREWAAYVGAVDQLTPHRHLALQLVVARDGQVSVEVEGAILKSYGVIVASRALHLTQSAALPLSFVYAEPCSGLGQRLLDILSGRKACALPQSLVADFRESAGLDEAVEKFSHGMRPRPVDPRLAATLREIERSPATELGAIARIAGISVSRLRSIARKELGLTLSEWALWRKLARALFALSKGCSFASAATEGGFADQAHFNRTMRRMFGVTPRYVKGAAFVRE